MSKVMLALLVLCASCAAQSPVMPFPFVPQATGGGGATYTFVNYTFVDEVAGGGTITSPALSVTAGDFVYQYCRTFGAVASFTFTSSPSSTWNTLTPQATGGGPGTLQGAWSRMTSTGSTTFSCATGAGTFSSLVVLHYTVAGSPSFDVQTGSYQATAASQWTSPAFSTGASAELVIVCAGASGSGAAWTAGTIGASSATLRGVSGATLTTATDSGCEDFIFSSTQTSITGQIGAGFQSFAGTAAGFK
jgi:hypothetical protein